MYASHTADADTQRLITAFPANLLGTGTDATDITDPRAELRQLVENIIDADIGAAVAALRKIADR